MQVMMCVSPGARHRPRRALLPIHYDGKNIGPSHIGGALCEQ